MLELIVTIPAYKEPYTLDAIKSLLQTELDPSQYLILVLFNYPESADSALKEQTAQHQHSIQLDRVFVSTQALPDKKAGVGLARKILMDSAAKIFHDLDKPTGVILAYDADCTTDYMHMDKVLSYFRTNTTEAASIYFEHDLDSCDQALRNYIIEYELHLRVYINWKKYIGLPYAFQTIGSSMAVCAGVYTLVGGMNKRKAGEDFYFLHKFTNRGAYGEIKNTTVYPSSRVSDRVPFGTGRAILEASENKTTISTYNPQSYLEFKRGIIDQLENIYSSSLITKDFSPVMISFLEQSGFAEIIKECKGNTSSLAQFKKRFYNRCDAFYFMKYLHFMRDHLHESISPLEAGNALLSALNKTSGSTLEDCLMAFRALDRTI